MTELAKNAVTDAANLLTHYGFDLKGETAEMLTDRWARLYPSSWLRLAVIEALYQGRYKAVSVEQILILWQRRGQPLQHFNHEFERIIGSKSPKLAQSAISQLPAAIEALPEPAPSFANGYSAYGAETNGNRAPAREPLQAEAALTLLDPADLSTTSQQPIHQFVPDATIASEFYAKLRAVAFQEPDGAIAALTTDAIAPSEPEEATP